MQSKGWLLAAGILLSVPPLLFVAFVIQQIFVAEADMLLWVFFLLSLAPCGLFAAIGCLAALFRKSASRQIIGKTLALVLLGVATLELLSGLFSIGLVLAVVGALK